MHPGLPAGAEASNQAFEPIVMRALQRFRALLPAELGLALSLSHDHPHVRVHADRLEHALLSMCIVAWQSMLGLATQIVVEMSEVVLDDVVLDPDAKRFQGGLPPRRYVRLLISNNRRLASGPGHRLIPAPAERGDRRSSAHRLQLVEVRDTIVQHHGSVTVLPETGRGTLFDVYLPTTLPLEAPAGPNPAGSSHVFYVDDYEAMRDLVSDTLPDAGFRVTCHESGQAALAALQANPYACDVLVSDYRLQAYSGIQLLRQVKQLRPDLPVIIISGYVDDALKSQARDGGAALVVSKAHDLSALCVALHDLLGHEPRPALISYSDWGKL